MYFTHIYIFSIWFFLPAYLFYYMMIILSTVVLWSPLEIVPSWLLEPLISDSSSIFLQTGSTSGSDSATASFLFEGRDHRETQLDFSSFFHMLAWGQGVEKYLAPVFSFTFLKTIDV